MKEEYIFFFFLHVARVLMQIYKNISIGCTKTPYNKKVASSALPFAKNFVKKKEKSLAMLLFFILFFSLLLDLSLLTLSGLFLLSDWVVVVRSMGSDLVMACYSSGGSLCSGLD